VGVLHTHNRRLDFHPHVHMVMPAAALDAKRGVWRTKVRRTQRKRDKDANAAVQGTPPPSGGYLFNHKALAKVFRAKVLDAIQQAGLTLPAALPELWVVDCKCVGDGQKALLYLGRYLYRGVIQERDILRCDEHGNVTFQYRDAKTDKMAQRTLPGADFLWHVLQHVLPKGLRRARNFGFLHHNSARAIRLLQVLHMRAVPTPAMTPRPAWRCVRGQTMHVVVRRMPPLQPEGAPNGQAVNTVKPDKPAAAQVHTMQ